MDKLSAQDLRILFYYCLLLPLVAFYWALERQ